MTGLEQRLIDGHLAAKAQRDRLKLRVTATRDRLTPQRLLSDARTEAEQQVRAATGSIVAEVKSHPVRTALLGGAVVAWIFRHPLIDHGPPWLKNSYALLSGRRAVASDAGDEACGDIDYIAGEEAEVGTDHEEPWAEDAVQQNDSRC